MNESMRKITLYELAIYYVFVSFQTGEIMMAVLDVRCMSGATMVYSLGTIIMIIFLDLVRVITL